MLDDFRRQQRRVRRSVVGHLSEATELLNRVLDDERRQLPARRDLRDDDRRVDVVRANDLQAHVQTLRRRQHDISARL